MLGDLHGGQKGQAMLMLAVTMIGLTGLLALVIDGGNAYLQRRVMQKAADAGALAGAHALALGGSQEQAIAAATEYAIEHNGAHSADVAVDHVDHTVSVVTRRSFSAFFAGVIGQPSLQAAARASASFAPVGALPEGVFPIGVNWQDYSYGTSYDIFIGGGPGNFGWLGWNGCVDTECLCQSITPPGDSENYLNPYDPDDRVLSTENWVAGTTGVVNASCMRQQLDAFIANQTPITLPVWDESQGTGDSCEYHVVGFAKFIVEDYNLPGESRITGRFVRTVTPGAAATAGGGYGVYRVVATE